MSENVRENSENGVFPEMIQLDRFFGPKTPIKKILTIVIAVFEISKIIIPTAKIVVIFFY